MSDVVLTDIDARGVATLTLNRPQKHNALDATLISELTATLRQLDRSPDVRVIVLTGAGESFCSGADLDAMRAAGAGSEHDNVRDAQALGELLATLSTTCKPTVARINGNAFGGGLGLICCCDIALAAREAGLALSEVRLGLVPATISPYVVAAIGTRQARRYFLSGESIDAEQAQRIGLVHETVTPERLDVRVAEVVLELLKGGPEAQREGKELIREVAATDGVPGASERRATAQRLARLRASEEGQEGINAFLQKRRPRWFPR